MRPRSGGFSGLALALVAFGILLLLRQTGVIPEDIRIWPIVVLAIGVGMLAAVFSGRYSGTGLVVPFVLIDVGIVELLKDTETLDPDFSVWPSLLIAIGAGVLLGGIALRRATSRGSEEPVTFRVPMPPEGRGVDSARLRVPPRRGGAAGGCRLGLPLDRGADVHRRAGPAGGAGRRRAGGHAAVGVRRRAPGMAARGAPVGPAAEARVPAGPRVRDWRRTLRDRPVRPAGRLGAGAHGRQLDGPDPLGAGAHRRAHPCRPGSGSPAGCRPSAWTNGGSPGPATSGSPLNGTRLPTAPTSWSRAARAASLWGDRRLAVDQVTAAGSSPSRIAGSGSGSHR